MEKEKKYVIKMMPQFYLGPSEFLGRIILFDFSPISKSFTYIIENKIGNLIDNSYQTHTFKKSQKWL